ncbi:MAG: TatA/E family twin arginine-targeting protein translocase [Gloeobacterales cyanobacterium]
MFGLGPLELGAIAVVALLIFGPKKIPELGKTLGQATKSFRQASNEFEAELKRGSAEEAKPLASKDSSAVDKQA